MAQDKKKAELLQGTLDMMVLQVLTGGSMHGYAIVRRIQQTSRDMLVVEEGSLYPALHRMERRGLIQHQWGLSELNRRAKYYRLTAAGRKRLKVEAERWDRIVDAVAGVMGLAVAEG